MPIRRLSRLHSRRLRRGAMLVLIAFLLVVFLVGAAFMIDVAYMQLVRAELQAATDAAAKAAVAELAVTQDSEKAIDAALSIAEQNTVAGRPLKLRPQDVTIGGAVKNGNGGYSFDKNARPANSAQVTARMDESGSGTAPLFFGRLMGTAAFRPVQTSTASHIVNEICLVIDRSHSMCFDLGGVSWSYPPGTPTSPAPIAYPPHKTLSRWATLVEAMKLFVETVESSHSTSPIGMTTFGSKITLGSYEGKLTGKTFEAVYRDVELTTSYGQLNSILNARGQNVMLGGTNLGAGMDEALKVLTGPNTLALSNKIMIVMTDGQWNQGRSPLVCAQEAKNAGIVVHTVTFLKQADQTDMKKVAEITGGKHYHADDAAELKAAFQELALTLPVALIE